MECQGDGFEAKSVYNPSVIIKDNMIYMLYRAEARGDNCKGRMGIAWSEDGINFTRNSEPVLYPEYDYEKRGCEDPRVAKFGDTYYMVYVANGDSIDGNHIALASSKDLFSWEKHGIVKMNLKDWDKEQVKAPVICPQKINGKYVMYFLGQKMPWHTAIGAAFSEDLIHWQEYEENPIVFSFAKI